MLLHVHLDYEFKMVYNINTQIIIACQLHY